VWALGMVLHQLIAGGELPFDHRRARLGLMDNLDAFQWTHPKLRAAAPGAGGDQGEDDQSVSSLVVRTSSVEGEGHGEGQGEGQGQGPQGAAPVSEEGKDFLGKLLEKDPAKRLRAAQLLEHPWFVGA
jgi:serine/threonine protein kinase